MNLLGMASFIDSIVTVITNAMIEEIHVAEIQKKIAYLQEHMISLGMASFMDSIVTFITNAMTERE